MPDDDGETLVSGEFEGSLGIADSHEKRIEGEQGEDDEHDAKQMAAVVVGEGSGVKAIPDAVEHITAGDSQEWRAEDESKGMNGDVVAHNGVEDKPR